jgi:hypothetical protein
MNDEIAAQLARLFPEVAGRYGQCERKIAYESLAQAVAVGRHRQHVTGIELYGYHCEFGDHWHLSRHAPTAAQRAAAQAWSLQAHPPRVMARERKQRSRAVQAAFRALACQRQRFRQRYTSSLGTPFPGRITAHYAELHRLLDQHADLVQRLLAAIYEADAWEIAIRTSHEFDAPCASWYARIDSGLIALEERLDGFNTGAQETLATQRQILRDEEQLELEACRQVLNERYTPMLRVP